jgi:hypothetical protein
MKKHFYAVMFLAVMVLLPMLQLEAQDAKQNEQLWYCWEETVEPDMYEEYLKKIRKLMIKPPTISDYYLLWDLSYTPAAQ